MNGYERLKELYLETKDIDCNNLDKIIFLCEDKTFYEAK